MPKCGRCGLAAVLLAWIAMSFPALAQPVEQDTAQAATQAFNISPQPLGEALIQFGRQADCKYPPRAVSFAACARRASTAR